ncbi:hypothetical protein BJX64DRAFT_274171 [Aspergillus heterothallicus]
MMTPAPELDDVIAERKERKRVQNRLNQRARRLRLQQSKSEKDRCNGRPYRVDRWRLEDLGPVDEIQLLDQDKGLDEVSVAVVVAGSTQYYVPDQDSDPDLNLLPYIPTSTCASASALTHPQHTEEYPTPPLPADHLLTLIHLNAWRGLRQNKEILWGSTFHYMPSHGSNLNPTSPTALPSLSLPKTIHPDTLFYGSSLITRVVRRDAASTTSLPETLNPTEPQMRLIHATWINTLPFPRMRENLIRYEQRFSHAEFVRDVVGDLVDTGRFFGGPDAPASISTSSESVVYDHDDDYDDEITSSRSGLIIWGEPHRIESWEATPGFLRKWMWVLEGCKELIAWTNHWRRVRGEGPVWVC